MLLAAERFLNQYLNVHGAVERLTVRHNINIHEIKDNILIVSVGVFVILLHALVAATRRDDSQTFWGRAIHGLVLVCDLNHIAFSIVVITVRVLGKDLASHPENKSH